MIFAEVLALLALAGGSAFTIIGLARHSTNSRMRERQMQDDLRAALQSKDYRRLEDWLILYADTASSEMKKHVQQRRDELYVEANA